jgi:hypothetical protein
LVDSNADKVYKYTGAAGSQSAASSFRLNRSDTNPQDIVTDDTSFWVVDGSALKVFKYSLSGSSLGSWTIDAANKNPTGITINPTKVSDIRIVDNSTNKVYQNVGAATRTSGSRNAAASFALNANDTNPQGIADAPAGIMLAKPNSPAFDASVQTGAPLTAAAFGSASVVAGIPSFTGRDALAAIVGGDTPKGTSAPFSPPAVNGSFAAATDRALLSFGTWGSDWRTAIGRVFDAGAGSELTAAELIEDAPGAVSSLASPAALDNFFAILTDQPPSAELAHTSSLADGS